MNKETEKSSIPEGATHYANESDVDYFLWCKIDSEGRVWGLVDNEGLISTVQQIEKPRTKAEFVKLRFYDVLDAVSQGEVVYTVDGNEFVSVDSINVICKCKNRLYRKVETEIDERQEFIDSAIELLNQNSHDNEANHYKEWFGSMFDSGQFKLVE